MVSVDKNSQWFSRQAECFDYADGQPTRVLCLARDHQGFSVADVEQYACVVRHDLESIVQAVKAFGDAHLYEVIRADKPACAFMDVDFVLEDIESHEGVLRDVVKAYREFNRGRRRQGSGHPMRQEGQTDQRIVSRTLPGGCV